MLGTLQARLGAILGKASLIAIGTSILGNEDHTEILAVGKCIEIAVEQITHHGIELGGNLVLLHVVHLVCHDLLLKSKKAPTMPMPHQFIWWRLGGSNP